ncbi:Graves disease carrier protein [Myotis brandtii]|uniref:Graves disease carrier protein n=2 Tax=Vespertilionidae TaxID=9431 RepID=S7NB49_MYOBR|nr:Graves disease carrier protein [Myotis brandtii]
MTHTDHQGARCSMQELPLTCRPQASLGGCQRGAPRLPRWSPHRSAPDRQPGLGTLSVHEFRVFSTLRAVPQKEGYLGLYKGNGAMMIRIFPYGAIQFMAFEHYKTFITTKLGISGHVHRLMAGSMAGMTAVICTYPLDMVRVRLAFQVKGEHTYTGIIHAFKTIYAKFITTKLGISGHVHRLMAGSMAGMTAVICTYPLDMVRVRLAFQVKGEHTYTGIIHAFKTIYAKEGGFLGFYRGLMPTILGMAPYAGVSFFTFGTLKSVGLSHAPTLLGRPSSDNPNVLVLKTHINLLCGGVAGAIAQTISYPFDVTRRRMQLGTVLPEFEKCLTMRETMKYVYGHHGIRRGLYRGLSLNYIRCIPSQAVAFTTYELMKQFFHLN